jgi:hypothetical protein
MSGLGEKCEIRVYTIRSKKDGSQVTTVKDGLDDDPSHSGDVPYALVSRRVFNDKNVLEETTLQVNSPHLLRLFKEIIKFYPTVPADFESPFEMTSPFQMLYHYWDDLHQARDRMGQEDDDEARMHLSLLLDFMKLELGPDKVRVDNMISNGCITFSFLWTLFCPGSLVYTSVDSHPWLLYLEKTAYEENTDLGKFLEVHCKYTNHDGSNIGQASHMIRIVQKRTFAAYNPCKVTSLPVFPRQFQKEDELDKRLTKRGERFLTKRGVLVMKYEGLARYLREWRDDFYHPDMDEWPNVWISYAVGRI